MDRTSTSEFLVNISQGGAGFYSSLPLGSINVGRTQTCTFEFPPFMSQPLRIQARIIHITEIKKDDKKYVTYGVEFLEAERVKVEPLISELERMTKLGLIEKT